VWNQWRKEHPDILPDLSSTKILGDEPFVYDTSGIWLIGVDLNDYDLSYTYLSDVDRIGADLIRIDANLRYTLQLHL